MKYTTEQGLPSSCIYSIYKDYRGFLWFTSDAGISAFDSHSFATLNRENGLSDNEVFQMKSDSSGRVWLFTLNGKVCFFFKNKLFNALNTAFIKSISDTGFIVDFYEDAQKSCYFVYRNGEIIMLKKNGSISRIRGLKHSNFGVWKTENKLLVLCNRGLYETETKQFLFSFPESNAIRSYHIGGDFYFSRDNQIYVVNKDRKRHHLLTLPKNTEITRIRKEISGKLWVCTRDGLFLYEKNKLKSHFFVTESISDIEQDFEGGYWLSTLRNGIMYVPSFEVFNDNLGSSNPVRLTCIASNEAKEIWTGDDRNNYSYKTPGSDFKKQTIPNTDQKDQIKNIRFFGKYTFIVGKKMTCCIDSEKRIIARGLGGNDILLDDAKCFLGYNITFKFRTNNGYSLPRKFSSKDILTHYRTNVIAKDSSSRIWLGTNSGLKYYSEHDSIQNWDAKAPILQQPIEDLLFEPENNRLFVATSTSGLYVLEKDREITVLSKENGLNSLSCNAIKKISNNYFIVATNNGLNSIRSSSKGYKIQNLNALIGLRNKKINDLAFQNDTIYLATDNGLIYFNQGAISSKKINPKCFIQQVKSRRNTFVDNFPSVLQGEDNEVIFKFIGISFMSQNNLTYYYRLKPLNNAYNSTFQNQLNYTSLLPGEYMFSVFCVDSFGRKSKVDSYEFEVPTPFWKRIWFVLICGGVAGLLIYTYLRYRLRKVKKQFELEKTAIKLERDKANLQREMVELEQKALRLQMNPHFIFNALNTIKGYYSEGDAANASAYISKFSKLLRILLENTQQLIPLSTELEMLELYIELAQTRYKNKFTYHLIVDKEIKITEIALPSMLLQPIVENAIVHGLASKNNSGILKVCFSKDDVFLRCVIEDNGIGREASAKKQHMKEHQSKAIEITKNRIQLFDHKSEKSKIEIVDLYQNGFPSGTKVIVTLPLISIW